jgi:vacuolar protein sorting-associated protein 72
MAAEVPIEPTKPLDHDAEHKPSSIEEHEPSKPPELATPPDDTMVKTSNAESLRSPATPAASDNNNDSFLRGIHEYADLPAESNASNSKAQSPSTGAQDPEKASTPKIEQTQAENRSQEQPVAGHDLTEERPQMEAPASNDHGATSMPAMTSSEKEIEVKTEDPTALSSVTISDEVKVREPAPVVVDLESAPEPPRIEEDSTRNMVVLEKFDELSTKDKLDYSLFFNKRIPTRAAKTVRAAQELCPVTALPVRYRDPGTGIAYANALAYKKLQDLLEHKYVWSSMLGCYVGREDSMPARGVPEGWT